MQDKLAEFGVKYQFEQYTYVLLADAHRSQYQYEIEVRNTETDSIVDSHLLREIPTEEQARSIVEFIVKARRVLG